MAYFREPGTHLSTNHIAGQQDVIIWTSRNNQQADYEYKPENQEMRLRVRLIAFYNLLPLVMNWKEKIMQLCCFLAS